MTAPYKINPAGAGGWNVEKATADGEWEVVEANLRHPDAVDIWDSLLKKAKYSRSPVRSSSTTPLAAP